MMMKVKMSDKFVFVQARSLCCKTPNHAKTSFASNSNLDDQESQPPLYPTSTLTISPRRSLHAKSGKPFFSSIPPNHLPRVKVWPFKEATFSNVHSSSAILLRAAPNPAIDPVPGPTFYTN